MEVVILRIFSAPLILGVPFAIGGIVKYANNVNTVESYTVRNLLMLQRGRKENCVIT